MEANTDTEKTRFLVSSSSCAVPVYRDDYSLTGEYIPPGVYEKQSIVQLIRLGDVDPEKCKCASALDGFTGIIFAKRGSEDSGSGLGVAEETTATDNPSETTAGEDLDVAEPIPEQAGAEEMLEIAEG